MSHPALPPDDLALLRGLTLPRLSRRALLAGLGTAGVAGLSACGTKAPGVAASSAASSAATGSTSSSGSAAPTLAAGIDVSSTDKVVKWSNWPAYLDQDTTTNTYPTLKTFQSETGIKVTYAEDVDDNETFYGKVQAQLKQGKDIGRDIVVLTDWMAARMIRQGYVQKLDHANIPNLKNLRPDLLNVSYDKGRNYSLTWQSGFTGIGYNIKKMKEAGIEPKSISDLWNPKLKNRVVVLSEMRDTIGLIMLDQGKDPATFTAADFAAALAVLETQVGNGQIRSVTGNSYLDVLSSGDAVAAMAWSGDIAGLGKDFAFVVPDKGGMLWSDNMMIPIGATHKRNAEAVMNYYYDPAVMAKVEAANPYVCPVDGTQGAIGKIDAKLASDKLIFPPADVLAQVHMIRALDPAEETSFSKDFSAVLGL